MLVVFFHLTGNTYLYTLSLHDALPIYHHINRISICLIHGREVRIFSKHNAASPRMLLQIFLDRFLRLSKDRKSTRLNSSHANISYAVFCLKKKNGTMETED